MKPYCIDDDGNRVRAGDSVFFSYGIPPVRVVAEIIERDGKLVALTPSHSPSECRLNKLRYYIGAWYKHIS